jgi:hypothetical protein
MKEMFHVGIVKADREPIDRLCTASTPESAAEVVRALLACQDDMLSEVRVTVSRFAAA